jgi:hypothetical protein
LASVCGENLENCCREAKVKCSLVELLGEEFNENVTSSGKIRVNVVNWIVAARFNI